MKKTLTFRLVLRSRGENLVVLAHGALFPTGVVVGVDDENCAYQFTTGNGIEKLVKAVKGTIGPGMATVELQWDQRPPTELNRGGCIDPGQLAQACYDLQDECAVYSTQEYTDGWNDACRVCGEKIAEADEDYEYVVSLARQAGLLADRR